MAHLLSNHKKLISVLLLIFLISFLGVFCFKVNQARADTIGFFTDPLGWFLTAMIGLMSSLIVWFGKALELAVTLLKSLLLWPDFTKASIVQIGWRIIRDLANMFFVFILLVIAFATILRRETYGMKALLPKLVIAALLINFSLVIAGVIIDSSQVLTDFFISQSGGSELMSDNMMNATQAVKAIVSENENIEKLVRTEKAAATGNIAIGAILTVIFLALIFFVFAAYAFFLIVRMVFLWFLLIFAPIVWILWVMPQTKHLWNDWWKSFLKWCFFAPISAFFIYLSIFSYKMLLVANVQSFLDSNDTKTFLPLLTKPANLLQFLLTMSILFGGLVIAQRAGVYGADGAIGLAKGMSKGTAKWTGKRARLLAAKPVGATGRYLARTGKFGKMLGLRQIGKGLRGFEERTRGLISEQEKKYSSYTNENLKAEYRSVDPAGKAAIAKILAKRGSLSEDAKYGFSEKEITQSLKLAKRYNQHKDIIKSRPDLARLINEDPKATIKGMKQKDMETLQSSALGKIDKETGKITQTDAQKEITDEIEKQLKPGGKWKAGHIAKMAENPDAFEIVGRKIIGPKKNELQDSIKNYLDSVPGKAVVGDIAGMPKATEEPKTAEEPKIITAPTEEEFKKAKTEGYKGK